MMALDPQVKHLLMLKNMKPSLRYTGSEPFDVWQQRVRTRLEGLLGLPFEKCDDRFHIEWEQEYEHYTETRFTFDSEENVTVVCHLLLPHCAADEKVPLIICLQGHATGMHISLGRPKYAGDEEDINDGDRDFARQSIARGQAALTIDQRGMGERGGDENGPACYQPAVQALLLKRTLLGERCWDVSRSIDVVLDHFPSVDRERIAVTGNSGGGTTAIYAAALDTRIAAAMPSCALCGYEPSIGAQHHCLCNYVPGIALEMDMGDLAALAAPRPLVVVNGQKDGIFPLASAKEQVDIARVVYRAAQAEDKIAHVVGQEGHRFYAADAWPVFDALTGWQA